MQTSWPNRNAMRGNPDDRTEDEDDDVGFVCGVSALGLVANCLVTLGSPTSSAEAALLLIVGVSLAGAMWASVLE